MLCWETTAFASDQSTESLPFPVTPRREVTAFLRKEVSDLIESVLKDFPEDVYLTRISAKFYFECKEPLKSMVLLEEGLRYHPENFDLNNMAAKIAFQNGDYEKAIRFGQKTLMTHAKNPNTYEDLAEAMLFSGHYLQAVECLDKKIALLGGSERSYWLLGKGHMFLMNYEKAKEYYEKAKEYYGKAHQKNPSSLIVYYSNMAKVYMRLKQPEKAKEYMKRHSEMVAVKKIQELENAKSKTDQVILDSSKNEVLIFSKGLVRLCNRGRTLYLDKQQPEKAETLFKNSEDIFKKSITIAPQTPDIYREFADLYLATEKKLSEALSLAQKASVLEASAENYFVLGRAYYKNSDLKSALWALEQALKREPNNSAIRNTYHAIVEMTR
ncbi:MAG: hypothetical protein H8E17_05995 [Deltaproteobacteria bacterium]|nr:hypothetical protein [Deltaproteobacteria bacterium]